MVTYQEEEPLLSMTPEGSSANMQATKLHSGIVQAGGVTQVYSGENPNIPSGNGQKDKLMKILAKTDEFIQDEKDGKNKPMVTYAKLIWTLSDKQDKTYFILGLISSALCGLGLPSFVFLFGDIADSFEGHMDPKEILASITRVSKLLAFIGLGVWLGSYLFFTFLTIASERVGLKTRTAYL